MRYKNVPAIFIGFILANLLFLIFYSSIFNSNPNVDANTNGNTVVRKVYTGSRDSIQQWIEIPEIDTEDMPSITLYIKIPPYYKWEKSGATCDIEQGKITFSPVMPVDKEYKIVIVK